MQVVIDIDENLYTRLFDNGDINAVDMLKACATIRKGKALPKGHGRIGDLDAIIKQMDARIKNSRDNKAMWEAGVVEAAINAFAQIVIEADWGDAE